MCQKGGIRSKEEHLVVEGAVDGCLVAVCVCVVIMSIASSAKPSVPAVPDNNNGGGRQVCVDLCEDMLLDEDVRSRVLSYLTYIEGLQVSARIACS